MGKQAHSHDGEASTCHVDWIWLLSQTFGRWGTSIHSLRVNHFYGLLSKVVYSVLTATPNNYEAIAKSFDHYLQQMIDDDYAFICQDA